MAPIRLITLGALQSNHARQTAAAAAKVGLKCVLVLEERRARSRPTPIATTAISCSTGCSARRVKYVPRDTAMVDRGRTAPRTRCAALAASPTSSRVGGSNAIGALGYVGCATRNPAAGRPISASEDRSRVVHATGSNGTQAGLDCRLRRRTKRRACAGHHRRPVHAPSRNARRCRQLVDETWAHLGLTRAPVARMTISRPTTSYFGEAYGVPTPAMREAVQLLARNRVPAAGSCLFRQGHVGTDRPRSAGARFGKDENIVFVHTGGQAGLFAYEPTFAA